MTGFIENMHQFVADTAELEIGSMRTFLKQAEAIYEENLAAYIKIVLRRPFAKIQVSFQRLFSRISSIDFGKP